MNSIILRIATRYMMPVILFFSVALLMRGHNNPGGGFVGGLLAAGAFVLYSIAFDVDRAKKKLRVDPRSLIGFGLLTAVISGIIPFFCKNSFMTSKWGGIHIPLVGEFHFGTPVMFDIGVYFVVIGVTLTIIFSLSEIAE